MGQEPDRCGGWRTQRGDPGYMVGGDTEFPGDPVFSQFIKTATPGPDLAFASSIVVIFPEPYYLLRVSSPRQPDGT